MYKNLENSRKKKDNECLCMGWEGSLKKDIEIHFFNDYSVW